MSGVGWTRLTLPRRQKPLMWGWARIRPWSFITFTITMKESGLAEYSPYANETVDCYMDEALASMIWNVHELWKKAQWDGEYRELPRMAYTMDYCEY